MKLENLFTCMIFYKPTTVLTSLFLFLFLPIEVFSFAGQENEVARAIRLFDNGEFQEAEPIFKKLLDTNSEHIMLNYYYGACRTENGFFSITDLNHLQKASGQKTPVRINYYLGIQYHARSEWVQALRFYNKFKLNSTPGEQVKVDLPKKIQQCYAQINPFNTSNQNSIVKKIPDPEKANNNEQQLNINQPSDTLLQKDTMVIPEIPPVLKIHSESDSSLHENTGEPIEFIVNAEITYLNTLDFRTEKGRELFEKGNSKQKQLNFSIKRMDELRGEYSRAATPGEKNEIGSIILSFEQESYSLKTEITSLLQQAKNEENEYWMTAANEELEAFRTMQKSRNITTNNQNFSEKNNHQVEFLNPDYLLVKEENANYPQNQKTENVIYKIQIGAYSRGLPAYVKKLFEKLSVIRKIEHYTDEDGVVVYTTGNLSNLDDAKKMEKQVQQEGVKDAYIVPYFNGKRITLERAKEITGEQ